MPDKEKIRGLFDDIAHNYDAFNHLSSFGSDRCWRRRAVRHIADERRALRVLDVATGTADFALSIASKLSPGSNVVGADLSEGMLEIGRAKVAKAGYDDGIGRDSGRRDVGIRLIQADVEALPFADGSFDRVSVAFGVRNFENLDCGLSEMCRVLRKGGRLVILELSYPDSAFLLACYKFYAFTLLPCLGKLLTGNRAAYRYLPASIMNFPKPPQFIPRLLAAGFTSVRARSFTFGVCRMYVAEK
ncbi:MAG: bifunctional demethylmenaquinone methyltransferase/2-methoxy-6-polyprenyl-1,4-benzoquinol methylase UbiE [Bacteroidia bacterium]|nr:bifunctional demethylmenaquinone methyltransferase/2-methoxy-6-polyprenyl-1,4-benzoquinol methylase UbiE [Bacteroidia bacterium]